MVPWWQVIPVAGPAVVDSAGLLLSTTPWHLQALVPTWKPCRLSAGLSLGLFRPVRPSVPDSYPSHSSANSSSTVLPITAAILFITLRDGTTLPILMALNMLG